MRTLAFFAFLTLVSLEGCGYSPKPAGCDYEKIESLPNVLIRAADIDSEEPLLFVTLVQLLTSPGPFIDCPVATVGYLSEMPTALYLSQEHADLLDAAARVHVSINYRQEDADENGLSSTGCENKFVRVHGKFSRLYDDLVIEGVYKIQDAPFEQHADGSMSIKAYCWISAETFCCRKGRVSLKRS